MKILVLDDNELIFSAPADYFVDPHDYRKDTIVQVRSPGMFWYEYFTGTSWDEIWLDHDLGTPEYSGRDVSKKILDLSNRGYPFSETFVITTMNPVAAESMVSDISSGYGNIVKQLPLSFLVDLGVSRGAVITDKTKVIRRN